MASRKKSVLKKYSAKKIAVKKKPVSKKICKQVLVVGLGLIGASFAKALKNTKACDRVLGSTRSDKTLKIALKSKIIDEGSNDLVKISAKLNKGDVILIATPTLSVPEKLLLLKDALARGVIVTDAASVKSDIVKKVSKYLGKNIENFVPGHPIAGSEKSGIDAVNPKLYVNHRVILTPSSATNRDSVKKVSRLWLKVGAKVSTMSPEKHDRIFAATSHLPHILAYSLVDTLAKNRDSKKNMFTYAAGGFRDFTRIASSDPVMWRDIAIANKSELLSSIKAYQKNLDGLRIAIEGDDSRKLRSTFASAKAARDKFSKLNPSSKK